MDRLSPSDNRLRSAARCNAEEFGWFNEVGGLPAAFDSATLMKVLPKFHGPRARLEAPLQAIIKWSGAPIEIANLIDAANPDLLVAIEYIQVHLSNDAPDYTQFRCPRVALKCVRMLYSLYTTGFATFS
jgi:hypothetical protein